MSARAFCLPVLALGLCAVMLAAHAGCGNSNSDDTTLTIEVKTPGDVDPFKDADKVVITLAADPPQTFTLDSKSTSNFTTFSMDWQVDQATNMVQRTGPLYMEVFDASGNLQARGVTPPVTLEADPMPVVLWVNTIGNSSEVSDTKLHEGRADATAAAVDPAGVAILGGRTDTGSVTNESQIYSAYYHAVEDAGMLGSPRALAAAALADDGRMVIAGGEAGDTSGDVSPLFAPEILSPLADTTGVEWYEATATTDIDMTLLARAGTGFTALAKGQLVLAGGYDNMQNMRLDLLRVTIVPLDSNNSDNKVTVDSPNMLKSPRMSPAVVALASGAVVVLGGGDANATPGEHIELNGNPTGNTPIMGATESDTLPFQGVVAALSGDNVVVAAGWLDADGKPTKSLAVVASGTLTIYPDMLSSPRSACTVTTFQTTDGQNRVFVAGGFDDNEAPLATADLLRLDDNGVPTKVTDTPVALARARARHVAAYLPTGNVLLAGGIGQDGHPTTSVELYTACVDDSSKVCDTR
jgi:hypothetical protein